MFRMSHLPVPITGDTHKTPSYAVYGGAGWLRSNSLGFSVRRNDHIYHCFISYFCGGIRVRFGNGRMQICNDNQFHHTPNKKLTHSFLNCVSLIALYFLPGYSRQFPRQLNSTHSPWYFGYPHTWPALAGANDLPNDICEKLPIIVFFIFVIYLCKFILQNFRTRYGTRTRDFKNENLAS